MVFIAEFIVRSTCFGHRYAQSSGAQQLYRWLMPVVYGALVHRSLVWVANRMHNLQLHTRPTTCEPKRQVPQAATICITLELLMMGIMVPETFWTNNKFCNIKPICCIQLAFYFPRINIFWIFGDVSLASLFRKKNNQTRLIKRVPYVNCLLTFDQEIRLHGV